MSDLAHIPVPGLAPVTDESGAIPDLVSLLVASGNLFYEWDLESDALTWTGDLSGSVHIESHDTLASGDLFLNRIHPEDLPHRMISLSRHLERGEVFDHEFRLRDDAGQFVWVQERAIATNSEAGKPIRLTGVIHNIDARRKSEEEVDYLSNHDALTGQYNRLRLRESLEHVIAQNLISRNQGGLLLVGLDKLNAVSDVYGEETADAIVLAAARQIEGCMRSGDIVGRVGFDRFAVIVGKCNSA